MVVAVTVASGNVVSVADVVVTFFVVCVTDVVVAVIVVCVTDVVVAVVSVAVVSVVVVTVAVVAEVVVVVAVVGIVDWHTTLFLKVHETSSHCPFRLSEKRIIAQSSPLTPPPSQLFGSVRYLS